MTKAAHRRGMFIHALRDTLACIVSQNTSNSAKTAHRGDMGLKIQTTERKIKQSTMCQDHKYDYFRTENGRNAPILSCQ